MTRRNAEGYEIGAAGYVASFNETGCAECGGHAEIQAGCVAIRHFGACSRDVRRMLAKKKEDLAAVFRAP